MTGQGIGIRDRRNASEAPRSRYVEAPLGYVSRGPRKPTIEVTRAGARVERNFTIVPHGVRIANGRRAPAASLDREGFALIRHDTAVRDFTDAAEIEAVYYPEMERLLGEATGASRVVAFDHNLRLDANDAVGPNQRPPVRQVHNDFTERSAARRAAGLVGAEALA